MTTNSTFHLLPMARMLRWKHLLWVVCFYLGSSSGLQAQSFSEGFDDIATLPGDGWVLVNASSPLGTTDWFQGNPLVFPAFNGAGNSYIGTNYQNTSGTGTISNWLMSPTRNFNNGDVISFYTRTVDVPTYPDRLRLMLSSSGASTAIASFTTTLLTVNAGLTTSGYPNVWTQFSVTLSGLPAGGSTGRFALWYDVPNGGPAGDNSDYIGIDQVVYTIVPPSLCPAFGDAPPNVSIVNSTCSSNVVSGGSITAPGGTPCPAGSTLQYQVNSGSWSTIPPTYNQTGPVQSIKTRCVCDDDDTKMSAESIAMMTAPGVCPPLGSDFCGEVVTTVTYNSTGPVAINDATTNTATITVSGAGAFLTDLNMTTFILHTFASDLDITLTSPSGTVVTITTDNGAGNDDVFNGTVWDDSAPTPVTDHTYANLVTAPLLTP